MTFPAGPDVNDYIIACRLVSDGRKILLVNWRARGKRDAEDAFCEWLTTTVGGSYVILDTSFIVGIDEVPGRFFVRAALFDWWTVL